MKEVLIQDYLSTTTFIFHFSDSWMLKGGKTWDIRGCGRWAAALRREALAWLSVLGDGWQCKVGGRNPISHCFHLICFLSHISVCGARGRARRVRRAGQGWEFPSCFSSGAECEGNNSWSESRHSPAQGLFGEWMQTCDSHRYCCQWLEYLWIGKL